MNKTDLTRLLAELPPELNRAPELSGIDSLEALADAHIRSRREADRLRMVAEKRFAEMSPQDMQHYHETLGCPRRPEEYRYDRPRLPEGMGWDEPLERSFVASAHKAGLSNHQVQALLHFWGETMAGRYTEGQARQAQAAEQTRAHLHERYGPAYEDKVYAANRFLRTYGGEKLAELFRSHGLLTPDGRVTQPELIEALASAGEDLGEESLHGNQSGGLGFGMSQAQARDAWDAKVADEKFLKAYLDGNHPGHANAMTEARRLFQAMHPRG